eukprot:s758_g8.t1
MASEMALQTTEREALKRDEQLKQKLLADGTSSFLTWPVELICDLTIDANAAQCEEEPNYDRDAVYAFAGVQLRNMGGEDQQ